MVANPAKFQVMFLGTKVQINNFIINNVSISVTDSVKLLGITIDKKLNFKCHIEELCKKAFSQTKALFQIRPFLTNSKSAIPCVHSIYIQILPFDLDEPS